ncbi:methyltransferase domain-containing protein, partial [Falsiroseomonas oryziterrae]|uniref:methyltransferase domain-containing protein n=1 Tax=Falsiroseomonas oryziterrae TaxID=2911368 RepID=UPI0035581982
MKATAITACRSCGGALGPVFCDLSEQPAANSYVAPEQAAEPEPRFPLRAVVCRDCRLVQLDTVVDAEAVFSDYAYFSSASASWVAHAGRFAAEMTQRLGLGLGSFVVEVASNDGYLLRHFVAAGIPCLGIEPAANVAAVARAAGVPTEARFLDQMTARDVVARRGHAALVVANNVLAHVPAVNDFVAGLALLAGPRGVVSVEAPHLLRLVDGVQFDTIYHEHYNLLAPWLWIGSFIMALGGALSLADRRVRISAPNRKAALPQ